jgi:hypothetical protein
MVQIVENLTTIRGRIETIDPASDVPEYATVTVHVDHAEPVAGKADLLSSQVGHPSQILVRRGVLGDARPGDTLTFRASRTAAGTIMAEPDPDPGRFSVDRGPA